MKKVIDFVLKYKYQILLIILYLLFIIQMSNVYMYADDYNVVVLYKQCGNLIDTIIFYFKFWSGRLIGHTVVTFGLSNFGILFFRLLNPVFFFLFCFIIAKIVNVKNKFNVFKITFFVSLLFLGLNINVTNEFLYWADGTILYLWTYVPMLVIIYYLLDYFINNHAFSNLRFFLSIFFIIIINLTMESTAILIICFLFLLFIKGLFDKKINKKIIFLLIFSSILLICCYFVPGNLNRLSRQSGAFSDASLIGKFIIKLPIYFTYLFDIRVFSFLFIVSITVLINNKSNSLFDKICKVILCILNILFILNIQFFNIFNFSNLDNNPINIMSYIFGFMYLFLNLYLLFKINIKNNYCYLFLIFSGIVANFVSIILIEYTAVRFYFPLMISCVLFFINYYITVDKDKKVFLLLFFPFVINFIFGCIVFLIYYLLKCFYKKLNPVIIQNILLTIFVISNLFNFFYTIYCYYENSKVFDSNITTINEFHNNNVFNGYMNLKKLKYQDYAFHMPETQLYVLEWYKNYYELNGVNIVFED